MTASSAFEVAIGLIFIYLVLSIICTGLSGATAAVLGIRGRFLHRYIANFVGSEHFAEVIYRHPLIYSVEDQPVAIRWHRRRYYPAKIPGPLFALALVDLLVVGEGDEGNQRRERYERFFPDEEGLPSVPSGGLSDVAYAQS
jgi:hypothetical protein